MAWVHAIALFALTLLPAVPLTTAVAAPGTEYRRPAPSPGHKCGAQGTYAPGSAYEANLRLLAADIPANANASSCRCSPGNHAGERPDNVAASVYCYWRPDAGWPSDCAGCIARAFDEAQPRSGFAHTTGRPWSWLTAASAASASTTSSRGSRQSMGLGTTGEYVAADGDHASYLDLLQYINKELIRYMSEDEMMELKNFTERATQASNSPECLTS